MITFTESMNPGLILTAFSLLQLVLFSSSIFVQRAIVTKDRLYYLNNEKRSFLESVEFCLSKGMRQAIPRSDREDRNIARYAMDGPPFHCQDSPWLGGVFNFHNNSVTWLWNGNSSGDNSAIRNIRHYQRERIDTAIGSSCSPFGAGQDAVRQAKSLECADGSVKFIWWRYPIDSSCLSTSLCEFDISGLKEKGILIHFSNTSILLDELLERFDGGHNISISTLRAISDNLSKNEETKFEMKFSGTMDINATTENTNEFKPKGTTDTTITSGVSGSRGSFGPSEAVSTTEATAAIDTSTTASVNSSKNDLIFVVIGVSMATLFALVSYLVYRWCSCQNNNAEQASVEMRINQGRQLPQIPERTGPEELYEEIEAYRDYLALTSVTDDQYLEMNQQRKQALKSKSSAATESTNSYIF